MEAVYFVPSARYERRAVCPGLGVGLAGFGNVEEGDGRSLKQEDKKIYCPNKIKGYNALKVILPPMNISKRREFIVWKMKSPKKNCFYFISKILHNQEGRG